MSGAIPEALKSYLSPDLPGANENLDHEAKNLSGAAIGLCDKSTTVVQKTRSGPFKQLINSLSSDKLRPTRSLGEVVLDNYLAC